MGHIVTPNLGDKIQVRFTNTCKMKNARVETWEYVTVGNNQVYKTPQGRYMTKMWLGWYDVTDQVKE